jgi:hypothetical protein
MAVLFFVSAFSFSVQNANSWREHTYIVLEAAETFLNELFRIQQDSRNYVFYRTSCRPQHNNVPVRIEKPTGGLR